MRKVLSLFTIVFFVFGIFVYGKSGSNYSLESNLDRNGIVLGVSEEAPNGGIDNNAESKINLLPVVKDVVPVKNDDSKDYKLNDGKAVVMDCKSGNVIYNKDSDKKAAIASITKLATALVFLKNNNKLDSLYEVKRTDRVEGGLLHLRTGDLVEIKDLLNLSLVSSDNMATMALVNSGNLKVDEFVAEMNKFAKENGLNDTSFMDPVGLAQNMSTAADVAKLANLAFANEIISEIVAQKEYTFKTKGGRDVIGKSTNILLNKESSDEVKNLGGKTGFTNLAGYCFVGKFVDENNNSVISVVLDDGERTARFSNAKNLAKWAYDNFTWN